ncbi:LIM domain protein [compost metagenome]
MRRSRAIAAWMMALGVAGVVPPTEAAPMTTCASCRQPITSTYVQWGRQAFHPQHFTCAGCGLPIGSAPYVPHQGRPYHQRCYAEAFAERCGVCQQPLIGRYIKQDGKAYHEACFQTSIAEKCDVCGTGLTGKYFVDPWGNKYHAAHQRQVPNCDYCGRIISQRTSGGGSTYQDGRSVCAGCYGVQISGDRAAQPLIEGVRERLRGWGLDVPAEAAPVILVDRNTLRNLLRRTGHPGGPNVNGFTSVLTEKQGNRITKREMAVYILHGMPREVFEGTVAHELTHVWINLNNGRSLDSAFEEGSCNYFKYLLHAESQGEMAEYAIKLMQQDQDPAYGAGFRRVKRLVDKRGLDYLITLLARSTGFPLGY